MILFKTLKRRIINFNVLKNLSTSAPKSAKGIIVGVYENSELTKTAQEVDVESKGKLKSILKTSDIRLGQTTLIHDLVPGYDVVALVGVGDKNASLNPSENLDEMSENIRIAAGSAAKELLKDDVYQIDVDPFTNADASAEGSILSVWSFNYLKSEENERPEPEVTCTDETKRDEWERGRIKADAQNFARVLTQCPSNLMTPTHFTQCVIDKLCPCGVQVEARDRQWMESQNMEAFLGMASGSTEAPLMLEIAYCGGNPDSKPVMLIGKGVTFDGHGVCLDRICDMELSAEMAGAAVVVGTIKALCELKVPINVNAVIPLCENLPGGNAAPPGSVFTAINGKTIRVDDTGQDGRIFMVDALSYSERYKPCLVINIATMNETMRLALGAGATATYTLSESVWKDMREAGAVSGDRLWRFPLWDYYRKKVASDSAVDFTTVGKGIGGDPCTAAAFFKAFAPNTDFVHMDVSGTARRSSGVSYPYLRRDLMTGRPVRTLVEFFCKLGNPDKGN